MFKAVVAVASSSSYKPSRRGFATGSNAAPAKRAAWSGQPLSYQQMDYLGGNNWNKNDYYGQQVSPEHYQEYECEQMYEEDSLFLENVISDWESRSTVETPVITALKTLSSQADTTSPSFPEYTDPGPQYTPPIDSWDRWDFTNKQLRDATRLLQLKDYLANPPAREDATLQAQSSAVTTGSFDETQLETDEEEEDDVEADKKL